MPELKLDEEIYLSDDEHTAQSDKIFSVFSFGPRLRHCLYQAMLSQVQGLN